MLSILTTRRFKEWWWQAQQWFRNQLETVSVDLTPVEEKLDEVKEAVDNIDIDTSDLAKQGSNANATLSDTQAAVKDGNDTAIGMLKDATNGLASIKTQAANAAADAAAAKTAAQGITGYALQGTNSSATNTAIKSAVDALSPVADAAEAYNTGKMQLATNITAKGVQASSSETLPQLAGKVAQIAQQPIVWDESEVGDQYEAQLFGGADNATSPLWNLYEVLKNCKNTFLNASYEHEGNIYNYNALIVCEYYKGYDSLQLKGADAYLTCDGDFYNYSNPTHIWHDSENGKVNRWVCFLYVQAGSNFTIGQNDTAISPRSMYIGGHIGTITYEANGRLTDLVCGVEETDVVDYFLSGSYTQAWQFNCILRNIKHLSQSTASGNQFVFSGAGTLVIDGLDATQSITQSNNNITTRHLIYATAVEFVVIRGVKSITYNRENVFMFNSAVGISLPDLEELNCNSPFCLYSNKIQRFNLPNLKKAPVYELYYVYTGLATPSLIDVTVGELINNLNIKLWNPTNVLADATKKAKLIDNIKNHILARVSDRTGLSRLTFTISTNMYNAVSGENITWQGQPMTLADAFLTKNWLLAGA